jgi:hypothetical protein
MYAEKLGGAMSPVEFRTEGCEGRNWALEVKRISTVESRYQLTTSERQKIWLVLKWIV